MTHHTLLALLTLLGFAAAEGEWRRDVPNRFRGTDWDLPTETPTHLLTRVVDDATGRPIRGARLYAVPEIDHALRRLARPNRSAVADADGWIRYALEPDEGNWYYVVAAGYAPYADMSGIEEEVRLRRGRDIDVLLRDTLGRPVPGAHVGYYLGCGHTPDSRQTTTDEAGRAVIRCVDREEGILFPIAPGIEAEDWQLYDPGDAPIVIFANPGQVVEGTVLDADGEPLAGVLLRAGGYNHGPRTRADEHGRFRLEGVAPFSSIGIVRDGEWVEGFTAPPAGVRPVYRLRGKRKLQEHRLPIELSDAISGELDIKVHAHAVRLADGLTVTGRSDAVGELELELEAGRYVLVVGSELGRYAPERCEVEVAGDRETSMRFELRRHPLLRVDASGMHAECRVVLASATAAIEVTEEALEGAIPAPEGARLVLRLHPGQETCSVIVPVPPEGRGEARAPIVLPKTPAPAPDRPVLPDAGPVKILLPDGTPAAGVSAHCRGNNWFHAGWADDEGIAEVGVRGGDLTVDVGEGWLPLVVRLKDDGPWTVRLGSCVLAVEAFDSAGKPIRDFVFTIDGEIFMGWREPLQRGLTPGAHRVYVASGDLLAKDCRIVLADKETRTLRVQLSSAPR